MLGVSVYCLPDVGITWPALWEHKALGSKSWNDVVKRGLAVSKPVYFAQAQLYMAYMTLDIALVTVLNRDTQRLAHEVVPFDPATAQAFLDFLASDAGRNILADAAFQPPT